MQNRQRLLKKYKIWEGGSRIIIRDLCGTYWGLVDPTMDRACSHNCWIVQGLSSPQAVRWRPFPQRSWQWCPWRTGSSSWRNWSPQRPMWPWRSSEQGQVAAAIRRQQVAGSAAGCFEEWIGQWSASGPRSVTCSVGHSWCTGWRLHLPILFNRDG